jgi:hypothetical protein
MAESVEKSEARLELRYARGASSVDNRSVDAVKPARSVTKIKKQSTIAYASAASTNAEVQTPSVAAAPHKKILRERTLSVVDKLIGVHSELNHAAR